MRCRWWRFFDFGRWWRGRQQLFQRGAAVGHAQATGQTQGTHTVFDGLRSQRIHIGAVVYQAFEGLADAEQLINTDAAAIARHAALDAADCAVAAVLAFDVPRLHCFV